LRRPNQISALKTGSPLYTILDALHAQALVRGESVALTDQGQSITYAGLLDRSTTFAHQLQQLGLANGERVAIFLPRSADAVIALFGTWMAGGVGVFMNDVLKPPQIRYIVEHSDAHLIVSHPTLQKILHAGGIDERKVISVHTSSRGPSSTALPAVIDADLALLIYTSGSTGMPKGIMLSHRNLLSGAMIVADYLRITHSDVLLGVLPFSFDYGLNQLLSSVFAGARIVLERSVFPADICHALSTERVTGLAGVPMLWQQLAHPRSPFLKSSYPLLRYVTNTGGKMPEAVTRAIREAHPQVLVYLMFGLTEAFRSTFLPPDQVDTRPASIGKAIPNVEVLVLDEQGNPCPPGKIGELVHRGANISLGYWKDPDATRKVFRPLPLTVRDGGRQEVAVYSGDYVRRDEEGYLYYVGRKDSQLKSHGMRVSPEEVEEYLGRYGAITHAVAFGIPNTRGESDIIAAIVPARPEEFSLANLRRYCKKELPEYLAPVDFWLLEHIPQTSSGKPDRVKIREEYIAQAHPPPQGNDPDSSTSAIG
jgi:acyl-CoA ligase (AMP-forming) (exosortase A-associated)